MIGRRLLYAPNTHQGGGKVLLLLLLEALQNDDVIFVLDKRLELPDGVKLAGSVCRVKPTLISRLWLEWKLVRLVSADTLLLCMGNLPPLFVRKGIQRVFIQNRYLIEDRTLNSFPLAIRIRLTLERLWLRVNLSHVCDFIVQTPTMQKLAKNTLNVDAKILPFSGGVASDELLYSRGEKQYDFLYIASGEPHKNHKNLIDAWIELAGKNFFPSLCLTVDAENFPDLYAWVSDEIKKHGLHVFLIGECPHDEVHRLYQQSKALLYPSLFESFGLPLIEAAKAGLPILASDATYVTDVISPSGSFDPTLSHDIAKSVQSFSFNKPALLTIDLLDVKEFLLRVFSH